MRGCCSIASRPGLSCAGGELCVISGRDEWRSVRHRPPIHLYAAQTPPPPPPPHTHTHIHTHTHTHTRTHAHAYTHTRTHTHTHRRSLCRVAGAASSLIDRPVAGGRLGQRRGGQLITPARGMRAPACDVVLGTSPARALSVVRRSGVLRGHCWPRIRSASHGG